MDSTFRNLVNLVDNGRLVSHVDMGPNEGFHGIEAIPDAVEYLFSRNSMGKVIVQL